ncbi:MAG: hypothetical protein ISS82_04585 [Nanoarchaeota archaeon]|nr:hypothetical protein [Nanoarchaeota archaeon]
MRRKYKPIHKRKRLGEEILEVEKPEESIDIDNIDDEELGKLIKAKVIKWQDIKRMGRKTYKKRLRI